MKSLERARFRRAKFVDIILPVDSQQELRNSEVTRSCRRWGLAAMSNVVGTPEAAARSLSWARSLSLGLQLSVMDLVHFGSSLSLRGFARLGSSMSALGVARTFAYCLRFG